MPTRQKQYPITPDRRYFLVRGRLWRCTNPYLGDEERTKLVAALMRARRDVKAALAGSGNLAAARRRVQLAKIKLGERGPVWWTDGSPSFDRKLAKNTPYAEWAASLAEVAGGKSAED